MIRLTFLGTSSMLPTRERNHSSILLQYLNEGIMIDCGEGTQKQLRIANIPPTKITDNSLSRRPCTWHSWSIALLGGRQLSEKIRDIRSYRNKKIYRLYDERNLLQGIQKIKL